MDKRALLTKREIGELDAELLTTIRRIGKRRAQLPTEIARLRERLGTEDDVPLYYQLQHKLLELNEESETTAKVEEFLQSVWEAVRNRPSILSEIVVERARSYCRRYSGNY